MKKLFLIGGIALFLAGCSGNIGSVNQANEYHYTQVVTGTSGTQVIKTTRGTLGSVVITGTPSGNFDLYDATTTSVALRGNVATSSLTRLAAFPASVAAGTYVFDTSFNYGLMPVFSTTVATATITWR